MPLAPLFGRDLFSAGNRAGLPLTAAPASDGSTWGYQVASEVGDGYWAISPAGRLYLASSTGNVDLLLSSPPGSANYGVSALCLPLDLTTGNISIIARGVAGEQTYYILQMTGAGALQMYRFHQGGYVGLGSEVSYAKTANRLFEYGLVPIDGAGTATISAWLFDHVQGWLKPDGTFQSTPTMFATGTDGSPLAAGYAGIGAYTGAVTAATGTHIVEFNAGSGLILTPGVAGRGKTTTISVRPINQTFDPASPPTISATSGAVSTPFSLADSFDGTLGYTGPPTGLSDTLSDGTYSATLQLTGPSIYPPIATVPLGQTLQMAAKGFTDVVWSSSDPTKATVNASTGLVTPVAAGSATITATGVTDPTQTATMPLTIAAAPTTYITSVSNTPAGLVGTIGFATYDLLGNLTANWTTTGVIARSPGTYSATVAPYAPCEYRWSYGSSDPVSDFFNPASLATAGTEIITSVSGFPKGLTTVGYQDYDDLGGPVGVHSTTPAPEASPGTYGLPGSIAASPYERRWDTGGANPVYASQFIPSAGPSGGGSSSSGDGTLTTLPWDAAFAADATFAALTPAGLVAANGGRQWGDLKPNTGKATTQVTFAIAGRGGRPFDPSRVFVGPAADIDGTRVEDPRLPGEPGVGSVLSPVGPPGQVLSIARRIEVRSEEAAGFRFYAVNSGSVDVEFTILNYKQA